MFFVGKIHYNLLREDNVFPQLRSTGEKFPTGSEFRGELWEKREKNSLINVICHEIGLILLKKTIA